MTVKGKTELLMGGLLLALALAVWGIIALMDGRAGLGAALIIAGAVSLVLTARQYVKWTRE